MADHRKRPVPNRIQRYLQEVVDMDHVWRRETEVRQLLEKITDPDWKRRAGMLLTGFSITGQLMASNPGKVGEVIANLQQLEEDLRIMVELITKQ